MTFETLLEQAWTDHATDPSGVAGQFHTLIALVETSEQVAPAAQLITHVMGEHLGQWELGIDYLESLRARSGDSEAATLAINRFVAVLEVASGKNETDQSLSDEAFVVSDRIRVLAMAAGALTSRDSARAEALFRQSLELAKSTDLRPSDPANRALAVVGNNLACTLEEKSERSSSEIKLMILAAQTARKYWAIAGTWLETSRAEYRLAMTYTKAGQFDLALTHAQNSLRISKENAAPQAELSSAHEAIAMIKRAQEP